MLDKGKTELQVNTQFSLKFKSTIKTFNLLHEQECTNLEHLVTHTTALCTDVPDICTIIITGFSLHTKMCISSQVSSRTHQIIIRFTGHSSTVCPSMELALSHPSGKLNLVMDPRFLKNLWTIVCDALNIPYQKFVCLNGTKGFQKEWWTWNATNKLAIW